MTDRYPSVPTTPATLSLPGRTLSACACGLPTSPRTSPRPLAVTMMRPAGPPPLTSTLSDWSSSLSDAALSRSAPMAVRPSAALTAGKVPCRSWSARTTQVASSAKARTRSSSAVARTR